MKIDEAIIRYTDNAEYERTHGNLQGCLNFKQLAEWLKELKAYREAREEIIRKRDSSQWSELVVHGFSHAIYTIDNHLKEVNADEDSD
jgi:hypothetical protein